MGATGLEPVTPSVSSCFGASPLTSANVLSRVVTRLTDDKAIPPTSANSASVRCVGYRLATVATGRRSEARPASPWLLRQGIGARQRHELPRRLGGIAGVVVVPERDNGHPLTQHPDGPRVGRNLRAPVDDDVVQRPGEATPLRLSALPRLEVWNPSRVPAA